MAVNMLLSFFSYAREDMAEYRRHMPCGRLLIDSGAYSAASSGRPVDLHAYAEFLDTWRDSIDYAITLDVIGDSAATRRNTRWLHNRGHQVLPVFTRGGTPADFDAMVRDAGYVCVGGGVGMPTKVLVPRLARLQRRAEELGGGIHALGVGRPPLLRAIRPYSADSSNVANTFLFGKLISYDGRDFRIPQMVNTTKLRQHAHLLKAQGIQLSELARTGRHPSPTRLGWRVERHHLMVGMSVAFLCADEDTTSLGVPVPRGVTDTPGTHLYSAVTGSCLAPAVAHLDTLAHDPDWSVPLWKRYRDKHARQCRGSTAPPYEGIPLGYYVTKKVPA